MADTCNEVCDEVIRRLTGLGFDVGDDENHQPIFDALQKVTFISEEHFNDALALAYAVDNWFKATSDGARFTFGNIMETKAKNLLKLSKYGHGGS